MYNKTSIDMSVLFHRMSGLHSWDSMIGETELAIHQLDEALRYFKNQKESGVPFLIAVDGNDSTNKCLTTREVI